MKHTDAQNKAIHSKSKKQISSVKEAVQYGKEREKNTKKTGWEESGTGNRYIPKVFR